MVFVLAFSLFACKSTPSETPPPDDQTPEPPAPVVLQIFAANSLEKALPEVQALYTAAHPHVTFADTQFKASGDLVSQIQGGATPDILITASTGTMNTAANEGYINAGTRKDMFANDLVVVRQVGSNIRINSLQDVLGDNITKIAIGDADAVPAGQYANQALSTIGLYSDSTGRNGTYAASIESKVAVASSVGNAAIYVNSGDCQIGFVYSSDVYRFSGIEIAYAIPSGTHTAILYPGAVLKDSINTETAADFLNFCLTNPDAQRVWSQYGFEVL